MKQVAEGADVRSAGQDVDALLDQLFHDPQLPALLFQIDDVTPGDVGGRPGDAGVKEHQVRFQLDDPSGRQDQRVNGDFAVGLEADVPQAAVGGHHLVL